MDKRILQRLFLKIERILVTYDPTRVLVIGYLSYMVSGFLLLLFPFFRTRDVGIIDTLFVAVSAVSTTGLSPLDVGSTYNFGGELVILLLIQLGGIGYMTLGSFIVLQTGHMLSKSREKLTRTAFPLPESFNISLFLKSVVFYTLAIEFVGAFLLYFSFINTDIENPAWSAVFHSVSAFCTAGFSLNSDSFSEYALNYRINFILAALSTLGAIGFIVVADLTRNLARRRLCFSFTTLVILKITSLFLIFGTAFLAIFEPSLSHLPLNEKLLVSFFQTMTATTTVGFNTVDMGEISPQSMMFLFFLMLFGASPSGTGGGLKSTTFAALIGLVSSTLRRDKNITYMRRRIPLQQLRYAASAFVFSWFILGASIFLLSISESQKFIDIVFEAFSALGTVGLSTGITGQLTDYGKIFVILLMIIGRVGVLSFGLAISTTFLEEVVDADNELVI